MARRAAAKKNFMVSFFVFVFRYILQLLLWFAKLMSTKDTIDLLVFIGNVEERGQIAN